MPYKNTGNAQYFGREWYWKMIDMWNDQSANKASILRQCIHEIITTNVDNNNNDSRNNYKVTLLIINDDYDVNNNNNIRILMSDIWNDMQSSFGEQID